MKKECKQCDYDEAVRHGRCDWRCKSCGRQLMIELYYLWKAGYDHEDKV